MNLETAKAVTTQRSRITRYKAMQRAGDITQEECDVLVASCEKEIAALRGQRDLVLDPPQERGKKGGTS